MPLGGLPPFPISSRKGSGTPMPHPKVCGSRLAEFEQLVRDVMTSYDAAGTAVSIFGRDRTYYEAFFGWRDAKRRLEIAPDTLFGMASLTKSVTCVALLQLVERGLVDLQGLVSDYIPEFIGRNQKGVRVAHLLSHSAGFFPEKRILARWRGVWTHAPATSAGRGSG
ncbi:class A beta-lactamase-related serine hydrolase [Fretibacterium sp. OH1220_COT-178]|nr:class A beta-lactamase-related serine hydrolase [Fretibacterium sp. OH1220_COT-178]